MIDYLQKGQTFKVYYASKLCQLKVTIKFKRHRKVRAGVLLLRENAPIHTELEVAEMERCGFELLPHAPYSPV